MSRSILISSVLCCSACATIVDGNERALFYSAGSGLEKEPVTSGWYWHLPWNGYIKYDLRWTSHVEQIHIHSKDNLHLNVDVAVVVRPSAADLFALDTDAGPDFYEHLVKPAVFAATRDASATFNHLEIATRTHDFESAIRAALTEHLKGQHLELAEVAVQHFDLPPEVEAAANRMATSTQELANRGVALKLSASDAQLEESRRRGLVEAAGLERRLKAEQDLEQAKLELQIEEERRKAQHVRLDAEADAVRIRADAQAQAARTTAEGEKAKFAATAGISPNYLRLHAIDALGKALSGEGTRMFVVPSGKDGMPAIFNPFFNPYALMSGANPPEAMKSDSPHATP